MPLYLRTIIIKNNKTDSILQKPGSNYNYSYGLPMVKEEQAIVIKRLGTVSLEDNTTKEVTLEVILWL